MRDGYFDTGNGGNGGGQLFGEIHGAMLSAGAAKRYLKMIPPILPVLVDRLANENLDRTEKLLDFFRQPPEEIGDRLVTPRIKPQRLIPERIGHRSAIWASLGNRTQNRRRCRLNPPAIRACTKMI